MRSRAIGQAELEMLKTYPDTYGPGNYPVDDDAINFCAAGEPVGPSVYAFASSQDELCPISVYRKFKRQLKTF